MWCGQKNETKQNTHQATNQARQVSATSGVSTPGAWAGTRQGPTAPPAPPGPGTARWRPSVGSWILHPLYLPDGQKCCRVPSPHTLALYPSPVPSVYEAQAPPAPPLTLLEGRGRLRSPALAAAEDRLTVPVLRDTEKRLLALTFRGPPNSPPSRFLSEPSSHHVGGPATLCSPRFPLFHSLTFTKNNTWPTLALGGWGLAHHSYLLRGCSASVCYEHQRQDAQDSEDGLHCQMGNIAKTAGEAGY